MKLLYNGSHGSVDVPSLGLFGVEPNEPVEIDDQAAEPLLSQGWSIAPEGDEDNEQNDMESDR